MTQTPTYQVTDPATGQVTGTFPFATDAEVTEALAAATDAFTAWRQRPVAKRAAVVKRIAAEPGRNRRQSEPPAVVVPEAPSRTRVRAWHAASDAALLSGKTGPIHPGHLAGADPA